MERTTESGISFLPFFIIIFVRKTPTPLLFNLLHNLCYVNLDISPNPLIVNYILILKELKVKDIGTFLAVN